MALGPAHISVNYAVNLLENWNLISLVQRIKLCLALGQILQISLA